MQPYYTAYEERYKRVYEAGGERWGHSPDDEELILALSEWVEKNNLKGKRIIEFACGEGASGIILSRLGCIYHGVDISPSAVEKATAALRSYPNTSVSLLDMVNQRAEGIYDGALDVMGFHMLITDFDREKYLNNAYGCLLSGAPMLFFRELFSKDAYNGTIDSIDDWYRISGKDYITLEKRYAKTKDGREVEVYMPLIPGRARTKEGYESEITKAGFTVDNFIEMKMNTQCPNSVSIFVHRQ